MAEETEIKLRWDQGAEQARRLLERHGFTTSQPRELEIDQIYDRDGELKAGDRLLRIRRAGAQCILTYKGPARRAPHKSREEIETAVADAEAMVAIVEALGFRPSFRYEKYRTMFARPGENGVVTMDETPVGVFLELEGAADWIDATARTLGFDRSQYITASYASLYAEYRRQNPGVPPDMRF